MKPEINKVKGLEAKIKWLKKEVALRVIPQVIETYNNYGLHATILDEMKIKKIFI